MEKAFWAVTIFYWVMILFNIWLALVGKLFWLNLGAAIFLVIVWIFFLKSALRLKRIKSQR